MYLQDLYWPACDAPKRGGSISLSGDTALPYDVFAEATLQWSILFQLLTANAEIVKASLTHIRRRINIAKVDNDRRPQRFFDAA